MKVHIVLTKLPFVYDVDDILIGVDVNAIHLFNLNANKKIAIGDFDSCSSEELIQIQKNIPTFIKASSNKDESDLELALQEALKYDCPIYVYGFSKGNRVDQYLNNLLLFYKYANLAEVHFIDEKNHLLLLKDGNHILTKEKDYLSFFSFENAQISIQKGFKYQGEFNISLNSNKFISNEFLETTAIINVKGKVIAIYASD